jgi:hypothetical protein
MKNIYFITFLFLFGCNSGYSQQQLQCANLCSTLNYTCNPTNVGRFEYDLCYDYCEKLPTQQEVDNFQSCSECYMAIECDNDLYATVCYPDCEQ